MFLDAANWLQIGSGATVAAGLAGLWYGTQIETKQFRTELVPVTITGAWSSLVPSRLRILHISDLHLQYPEKEKIQFLQQVTDDDFDIIALTGDIFEDFSGLAYLSSLISRVPARGAFAVLGNHDYYNYSMVNKTIGRVVRSQRHPQQCRNVGPMINALERNGFQVLRNTRIDLQDSAISIVGVDYPTIANDDLRNLTNRIPDNYFKLLLFHMPLQLNNMVTAGVHLALGGHTHGGQIRVPGFGAIITDSEASRQEASGLFKRGNTFFHISRGLGADPRSNIRLFCPPAATIIEVTLN